MYVFIFLLNKRCLILEAISDRFYLRKSCNFVKWALLLKYIKYLSILILRIVIFFCKLMLLSSLLLHSWRVLPVFVLFVLMQDISHNLETRWHTRNERERERPLKNGREIPGLCHCHWRVSTVCILSELSASPCVLLFLSGTFQRSSLFTAIFFFSL